MIGGSLLLFAWRAPRVGVGGSFEPVSRESMLLANNVLLLVACAVGDAGHARTRWSIDALGLGKLSVGPPYFDAVFVPLMAPALFLMGVGPAGALAPRRPRSTWRCSCAGPPASALASALLAPLVLGRWTPMIGFGLLLAAWIASTAVLNLVDARCAATRRRARGARCAAQPGSYYGMLLAHVGIAVFVVGVTRRRRLRGREATCAWSRATPSTIGALRVALRGRRASGAGRTTSRRAATLARQPRRPAARRRCRPSGASTPPAACR